MLFYNFPSSTMVSYFGPTFTYEHTRGPMHWYNVDLGPKCPIWMALKVVDGGGRGPCVDQTHLKSSPWSNHSLSTVGGCHMWIMSVQGGLVFHKNHLENA